MDKAGKLVVTFTWDQIPLFYGSVDSDQFGLLTASPYTVESPGVSRLPDSAPGRRQADAVGPSRLSGCGAGRRDRQLRTRSPSSITPRARRALPSGQHDERRRATVGGDLRLQQRDRVARPLDHRTTDVTGQVSGATSAAPSAPATTDRSFRTTCRRSSGTTRCGSRTVPRALGPRRDVSRSGRTTRPTGCRRQRLEARQEDQVFGNLSFWKWSQDGTLQPFTINTALPVYPLERTTADVSADVTGVYDRPEALAADDRTGSPFATSCTTTTTGLPRSMTQYVAYDTSRVRLPRAAPTSSRTSGSTSTRTTPTTSRRSTALKAGYGLESDKRTFRQFENTKDQTFRVSLDTTGARGSFCAAVQVLEAHGNRARRRGLRREDELSRAAPVRHRRPEPEPGDRHRDRRRSLDVQRLRRRGHDDYPDTVFGLQNSLRTTSVGATTDAKAASARAGTRRSSLQGLQDARFVSSDPARSSTIRSATGRPIRRDRDDFAIYGTPPKFGEKPRRGCRTNPATQGSYSTRRRDGRTDGDARPAHERVQQAAAASCRRAPPADAEARR